MSNNPRTNFLHMQVPQVPQITDDDFKVLCYLHYLDLDKGNSDKTVAVLLENNKLAVKAHESYAFWHEALWHEALNSPNAGIKDGKTILQSINSNKLPSKKPKEARAREAIENNDIEWIKNHWRNSENIYRNGGGKEPWYIFEGEAAYICGIIITLAFEALFELTRSDEDGHCSAGMLMWFVEVLSEETKNKIRAAGKKFLDGIKGNDYKKMQAAQDEANKAMNEELFGKENPGDKKIYEKLKGDFLGKIRTQLSLNDRELSTWIINGFDGFPAGDVLKDMENRMDKHFSEKYPPPTTLQLLQLRAQRINGR